MHTSFELQPTLKGNLVLVRPLKNNEFQELFKVASDPLIWQQHPQKDRYKKEVFQTYFDGALESGGAVVIEDAQNQIIGASRFYNYDPKNSQITIGYSFLARNFWGGQYNREVKSLMINHALKYVTSVCFEIGEHNIRSQKAIEKIGAKLIRTQSLDSVKHLVYEIRSVPSK